MASIGLHGIGKRFGTDEVLAEVTLEVAEGEMLVLVGPSGCGKSTLLRIVAGLEAPSVGSVSMDGSVVNELEPRARDVAMVFQNYSLYPHMSVRANLAFPLKLARRPRTEIAERVRETAQLLGLEELLDRKPGTLSGGQMQRVALGRAIVRNPRAFLFDEPLSNLDAKLRAEMRSEITRLHRRLGVTSIYVTHDQAEAMTLGSRICVLEGGRVQQIGAPLEVYERPANPFVASFIGSPPMNLLRGAVAGGLFRCGPLELPAALADGEVVLGIRPEHLEACEPDSSHALELEVEELERLGHATHVHGAIAGQDLLVVRQGSTPLERGARLPLRFPAGRLHWFDAATGRRLE